MDAPEHDVRRRAQAADLVALGLAIHAPDPRPERLVATGLCDLIGDAHHVERLRGPLVDLRAIGDEVQDNPLCLGGVRNPENADAIRLQGGNGPFDSDVVRQGAPPPAQRPIQVDLEFVDHTQSPAGYTCACKYLTIW